MSTFRVLAAIVSAIYVVLAFSGTAHAQLNALTAIAGPESSFGTNLQNPNSTASGIWQDINATWRSNLLAIGGDPNQYPTAISAPANWQAAVNAHLYNTQGFAPWTVGNAVLAQQIADHGGASAYSPRGSLSENPADYQSLNTPQGLQSFFNSNSGGSYVGSAPLVNSPAAVDAAAQASVTQGGFSSAVSELLDTAAPYVQQSIGKIQDLVSPWLRGAVALSLMALAMPFYKGWISVGGFAAQILRITIVVTFVASGSAMYAGAMSSVKSLPTVFSQAFSSGATSVGPAALFDESLDVLKLTRDRISAGTSTLDIGTPVLTALVFVVGWFALVILFIPYLIANFLLALVFAVGPVAIAFALFKTFDKYVIGFADEVIGLLMQVLVLDIVVVVMQGVLTQKMNSLVVTGQPLVDLSSMINVVAVLVIMAIAILPVPFVVRGVFRGGTAIALTHGTQLAGRATQSVRRRFA